MLCQPHGSVGSTPRITARNFTPSCWTWTIPLAMFCTRTTSFSTNSTAYISLHRTCCQAESLPFGPMTHQTNGSSLPYQRCLPTPRLILSSSPIPYFTEKRSVPSMLPKQLSPNIESPHSLLVHSFLSPNHFFALRKTHQYAE